MSIQFRVLGKPGSDNALAVEVNYGHGLERLLFDCGDGCLGGLSYGEIMEFDALFFSHLHMDHVGGFDSYFRCNFSRTNRPNIIWGPPETAQVMQHRFQGFMWNLHEGGAGTWWVHEVHPEQIRRVRFELHEAFAIAHEEEPLPLVDDIIVETEHYAIQALPMDHKTISMAYIIKEKPRKNIDTSRLKEHGLRPGAWLQQVKKLDADGSASVTINDVSYTLEELRQKLLVETPGDSIAYLTDFVMGKYVGKNLVPVLKGCKWMICESQYRHDDLELARANHHMTTRQVGRIAEMASVGELILFHLSARYKPQEWKEMRKEAQDIFANTRFPEHWELSD